MASLQIYPDLSNVFLHFIFTDESQSSDEQEAMIDLHWKLLHVEMICLEQTSLGRNRVST